MNPITNLARDLRGTALVEFALAIPILLTLLFGGVELSRFIALHTKLQSVVTSVGDLVTREEFLAASQLDQLFLAVGHILEPFDGATNAVAIVSAISATEDGNPEVYWQSSGGGALPPVSQIGVPSGAAVLPNNLPIRAGETIIVVEAYYQYEPLLSGFISSSTIRKVGYFRPRLGSLQELL